ncbi:ATPase [Sphingomonas sp. DBB INV C78]
MLTELGRRGYAIVEEPGRRIVAEELEGSGAALPWVDLAAFARRAVEMALSDRQAARDRAGPVFFDRGLVDAAAAVEHATGESVLARLCRNHRYNTCVFMVPPWPEIFLADDARRHDLAEAVAEYERLLMAYQTLGYRHEILPKIGVSERADLVLYHLERS